MKEGRVGENKVLPFSSSELLNCSYITSSPSVVGVFSPYKGQDLNMTAPKSLAINKAAPVFIQNCINSSRLENLSHKLEKGGHMYFLQAQG